MLKYGEKLDERSQKEPLEDWRETSKKNNGDHHFSEIRARKNSLQLVISIITRVNQTRAQVC